MVSVSIITELNLDDGVYHYEEVFILYLVLVYYERGVA